MEAAITRSDDEAAEQLSASLGDPTTAAAKTDAVLRDNGDPTVVQSRTVKPGFTAFGRAIWSLADTGEISGIGRV